MPVVAGSTGFGPIRAISAGRPDDPEMDARPPSAGPAGEFASFGHDYRSDMAAFVRDAYGLPEATDEQLARIEQVLRLTSDTSFAAEFEAERDLIGSERTKA
jgi:hypothetical protein